MINKALFYPKTFNIDDLKKDFEQEQADMDRKRDEWEAAKQKRQKDKKYIKDGRSLVPQ